VEYGLTGSFAADEGPPVSIVLREPFESLTFMNPLSEGRADELVRFLAKDLTGAVYDVGCGWAELLLRVVAASPAAHGIGVDTNGHAIEHGRELAQQRGLTHRVTLLAEDARLHPPKAAQAIICVGASQVWGPPVEDDQPVDYVSALTAIRGLVTAGARVVFGEGVWSRPPTAAAVAPLSGRLDELLRLDELVELAVGLGFMPVAVHEASMGEWDAFESGYSACYATWLAEHPFDHPDAREVRERAGRRRASYFGGDTGACWGWPTWPSSPSEAADAKLGYQASPRGSMQVSATLGFHDDRHRRQAAPPAAWSPGHVQCGTSCSG